MLKITAIKPFRTIKKDEVFVFDKSINIIVGNNGSGKSSLLQALRGKFDTTSKSLLSSDYSKLAECVEIEADYDKFFFLDPVNDNSMSIMNSFHALSFLENDGLQHSKISHGQQQHLQFNQFTAKLETYRKSNPDTKIMLVLDEFDKGFDLLTQSKTINALTGLASQFKADIICITHSLLVVLGFKQVFDMTNRVSIDTDSYCKTVLGI